MLLLFDYEFKHLYDITLSSVEKIMYDTHNSIKTKHKQQYFMLNSNLMLPENNDTLNTLCRTNTATADSEAVSKN